MTVDIKLAQRLADYLNDVLAHDKQAVSDLVNTRAPCGKALATHPTVQVLRVDDDAAQRPGYYVGLLGLLNGLCGRFDSGPREGWGPLVTDRMDDGTVNGFRVVQEGEE